MVETKVDEAQQGGVELSEGGHYAVIHIRGVLRAGREGEKMRMKDRIPSSGAGPRSSSTSLGHKAAALLTRPHSGPICRWRNVLPSSQPGLEIYAHLQTLDRESSAGCITLSSRRAPLG